MSESNTFPHQIRISFLGIPNKRKIKFTSITTSPRRPSPIFSRSLAFNLDADKFEPLWASLSTVSNPIRKGPHPNRLKTTLPREAEPCQPKQKYTRRSKPTKKNDKEFVEPWTIEEEIGLCKAFVAMSEDSVQGNGKKAAGFLREVVARFHEEMGEDKRSYDSVNCKWKIGFVLRKESSSEYLRIKERELETGKRNARKKENGRLRIATT
ncbi:hypothetical protein Tco_1421121 [Tanacetum coccineum]